MPAGTVQEKSYDGLLNLEALKVRNPRQQVTLNLQNTYGKEQEIKLANRTDSANSGSSTKNSRFVYDDEMRLTQAVTDNGGLFGTRTEIFTLDAVSNRTMHSKVAGAWQYDANNRLTRRGTGGDAVTYEYDAAGNLIKKTEANNKVTQYSYDGQNRLLEIKDGLNNLIASYGYDPFNRRIWKERYRDAQGAPLSQAQRTYYLYADEGLIAESIENIMLNADQTVTASGNPQIATQYGPRPDAAFTTGMLFIKTKNSNGVNTTAYYDSDQLQTPLQAADKHGNVMWSAHYNAFGDASITTPAATVDKPTIDSNLRLPGQYVDVETGLHYNYYRYYDPVIGRYITQDPIGLAGGINGYTYVGGNPVGFSDPLGLARKTNCNGPDCYDSPYYPSTDGPTPGPNKLPKSSENGPSLLDRLLGRDKKPKQYSCSKVTGSLGACYSCCASRSPGQYLQEQGTLCQQHCNEAAGISKNESIPDNCST